MLGCKLRVWKLSQERRTSRDSLFDGLLSFVSTSPPCLFQHYMCNSYPFYECFWYPCLALEYWALALLHFLTVSQRRSLGWQTLCTHVQLPKKVWALREISLRSGTGFKVCQRADHIRGQFSLTNKLEVICSSHLHSMQIESAPRRLIEF